MAKWEDIFSNAGNNRKHHIGKHSISENWADKRIEGY